MATRPRRFLFLLLACSIFGTGLLAALFPTPEPTYNGRRLSLWIMDLNDTFAVPAEYQRAFDAMGTNSVPWLLTWVRYDAPAWKVRLYRARNQVLVNRLGIARWRRDTKDVLAEGSGRVLEHFAGRDARIAIECERLLRHPNSSWRVRARVKPILWKISHPGQSTVES